MAPKERKAPTGSLHIDLKRPDPIDYRNAYIGDVMRHAIVTGDVEPEDPTVFPGIYLDVDSAELIEKTLVPVAPVAPDPTPAQLMAAAESSRGSGRGFSSLHAPLGSWNVSMAGPQVVPPVHMAHQGTLGTSFPRPPADYETDERFYVPTYTLDDRQRIVPLYNGVVRTPAPNGRPFYYMYTARVALFPVHSTVPVSTDVDGRPTVVIYNLQLDTAEFADTWVFGNLRWKSFTRITENSVFTDAILQAHFENKMKMPYPKYKATDDDLSRLAYGPSPTAQNIVYVKSGICGIVFSHFERSLRIPNFPIGVVYGATDDEITSNFDGLLGLGRGSIVKSRMNPKGRHGPGITLPEAAWRMKLIKNREFWIHVTDPTWDDDAARDFMCLGTYHNPFSKRIPTWLELECDPAAPDWKVVLNRITVYDSADSRRSRPNLLDYSFRRTKVIVDSGCSQTYMPGDFVDMAEKMFHHTYNVPIGSASYACPKSLFVCFYFISGGQERVIEAQAIRFFISPDYVDADHPALCLKPADRAIFGLNFFRTFIVGFRDDNTRPILTIGKHRTVPDDREPRLACRKPPDQTQEAGASTQTQAASDATRGAPAPPPPTRETGGRGNSGSSRLRKTSVSTPAKDARGGRKATEDRPGHRRVHSEQVEFPRYPAPLPGEDEGQGSSRYALGTNARAQQESTYGRRTGSRPPQQFQQPANAGGAGRNVPPAQRTRSNSLSHGAPCAAPPPAQPVPIIQQQWTQPGTIYPAAGAPLQRTTSQPLASTAGPQRRPQALPIRVPSPVPPPRQSRARTSSLTTGIKNIFGFGKKSDKR